jgi:hypothetical protein
VIHYGNGFTRLSITENTTDLFNIYILVGHQETAIIMNEFHVTPDDGIVSRFRFLGYLT